MDTASFPDDIAIDERNRLTAALSKELGCFIKSRSSTFACGGNVPIVRDVCFEYTKLRRVG